jgi:GNAT superfamily N-acetyltransferase
MIRECGPEEFDAMLAIVNDGAQAYRGVIPADCWHDPYMAADALATEIDAGVRFRGMELAGDLVGIMGTQAMRDVVLIRHAYVLTSHQRRGIGAALLADAVAQAGAPVLIGTWAAAAWAIAFYEHHGFRQVTPAAAKDALLRRYWTIPDRQIETSIVLADAAWFGRREGGGIQPPDGTRG